MAAEGAVDWFEDDAFWSTFDPYIFSADRLAGAGSQVERVIALAGVTGWSVLDLCCGTGRHAAAFAARGFRVTGVDRSGALLDRARAHAVEAGVEVELVECDMRQFVRPSAFDLVVNLFTSFGYFSDAADELQVLRNVHDSLRPGGTFVIDVMGKEILARIFQPTLSVSSPDGRLFVTRQQILREWTRVACEWVAIEGTSARSFRFEHWIYSGRELRELLVQTGFRDVRLFGDLDGGEYGPQATRLVATARRVVG
jgi:SAM-dependent methyltransferase